MLILAVLEMRLSANFNFRPRTAAYCVLGIIRELEKKNAESLKNRKMSNILHVLDFIPVSVT